MFCARTKRVNPEHQEPVLSSVLGGYWPPKLQPQVPRALYIFIKTTKFLTEFVFENTVVMCIMGPQNRDRNSTHDRKQWINYFYWRVICNEKNWGDMNCGCHPFLLIILFRNIYTFCIKSKKCFPGPELTEYTLEHRALHLGLAWRV